MAHLDLTSLSSLHNFSKLNFRSTATAGKTLEDLFQDTLKDVYTECKNLRISQIELISQAFLLISSVRPSDSRKELRAGRAT